MKMKCDRGMFLTEFKTLRPDNFTHYALNKMFDYFQELEEENGQEMDINVTEVCSEYSEYHIEDLPGYFPNQFDLACETRNAMFSGDEEDTMTQKDFIKIFIDIIREYTTVIDVGDHTIVIQDF